jgi:serine/threonine protein kinase
MDNLNVYYYQERGVELFTSVKKHRDKFWDQWKITLASKPKGYHLQHKSLWEQRMTKIFRGVFEAVAFLHSQKIVHRDLKLENMVAVGSEGNLTGKLIDFGVTLRHGEWEADMQNHGRVGTYPFMSPEMSFNNCQEKATKVGITIEDFESYNGASNDVWTLAHALWSYSMGVLLWTDISTTDARFTIATRARFCADPSPWRFRSVGLRYLATRYGPNRTNMCTENLIDLMEKILCPEKTRLTAQQCLEHPWFKEP